MVTMAKDVGFEAMPTHLRVAASVLQYRLRELIASSDARGPLRNPTESLKRVLDRAAQDIGGGPSYSAAGCGREATKRVKVLTMVCRHCCEHHEELMDPSLWGTLPENVRYGIFARLPLPKVITLQALSKTWKREMDGIQRDAAGGHLVIQSEFLRMCEEVHQNVALITRARENLFWVRLLDVMSNQWHVLQISAGEPGAVDITAASEAGGLVCFVSTLKKPKSKVFVVDVVNPLTNRSMKLPPLPKMSLVKMVQIVFDAGTKKFMVLVVGDDWRRTGDLVALVYDQGAESWSNALTWSLKKKKLVGFLYGYTYHWGNFRYSQKRDTPCCFDFVAKSLRPLKEFSLDDGRQSPLSATHVKSFAQLEDRVYILRRDKFGPSSLSGSNRVSVAYYIVEYTVRMRPKREWAKLKAHACKPFQNPPKAKYDLSLFACKGYLMVFARLPGEPPYRNEVAWLYDLATCKWSDLPKLPGKKPFDVHDLMCGLHWNTL